MGVLSFLNLVSSSRALVENNEFVDCHAPIGGAIHWDSHKPDLVNNQFDNVTASVYGPILASYPAYIGFINETVYSENLKGIGSSSPSAPLVSTLHN